jgi:hypothetical protein
VKKRLMSDESGIISSDNPQMHSSLKVGSRKRNTMESITRLERRINRNESEEGLCWSILLQVYPHVEDLQSEAGLPEKPSDCC